MSLLAACNRNFGDKGDGKSINQRQVIALDAFVDASADLGVLFQHSADGYAEFFFPAVMAGGSALFDFDNDGDLDILLLNCKLPDSLALLRSGAKPEPMNKPEPGTQSLMSSNTANLLLRQEKDGRFVDATEGSGLDVAMYGMGLATGDVNNDGLCDVFVSAYGPDHLFQNQGEGRFQDITQAAGIECERWGASAAFLDYDRDGWLDLFVTNYVDYQPGRPCFENSGRQDFCNPAVFPRTTDQLYHNVTGRLAQGANDAEANSATNGTRFEDATVASGIVAKRGAGLGVVCADFNRDQWPDIYVANDGHANFLWINQCDGTFRENAILFGVAYDAVGRGQGSMGVATGDLNGDGLIDVFITNLDGEDNAVYVSQTDTYNEISASTGMTATSFPLTGFGTALFDLENDGDLDLAVVNGRVRNRGRTRPDSPNSLQRSVTETAFWSGYAEAGTLFINTGQAKFHPVQGGNDGFAKTIGVGRGLSIGDIDNDGDVDMLVTYLDQPARIFRNQVPNSGHWLSIRAVEPQSGGRDAYGAAVTVVTAGKQWSNWIAPNSSYLSSHDPRLHFGLGQATNIDAILVIWADGTGEEFAGGPVDQFRVVKRGEGKKL